MLLAQPPQSSAQSTFTCVDAAGVRHIQDFPCAQAAGPGRASHEPAPAAIHETSPSLQPVEAAVRGAWKIAPLLFLGLFVVVAARLLLGRHRQGAGHRRRSSRPAEAPKLVQATRTRPMPDLRPDLPYESPYSARQDSAPGTRPAAWSLGLLHQLEWKRFELLCQQLWVQQGQPARLTGAGADGGVDVVIGTPSQPNQTFAIVQCKAWNRRPVGVEPVRALWGSKDHFRARLAIFYGLSGFTEEARIFAEGKHLRLIDGKQLLEQVERLDPARRAALLAQVTDGDYTTPTCPNCDIKMRRRNGQAGKPDFWGCPNFRKCHSRPFPVRS